MRTLLASYGTGRRRLSPAYSPFTARRLRELLELTSRVSTDQVAEAKDRLAVACSRPEGMDVALAANQFRWAWISAGSA